DDTDLEIKVRRAKAKRIKIKDTFHRCVEMVFEASGSKELLTIGYQAGFGERNSMGFGMVKVVNGRRRAEEG
ncbi:MAG: CRISPR-associated endoribonuclease Cas6, partial [Thermoplasmata archaeon]